MTSFQVQSSVKIATFSGAMIIESSTPEISPLIEFVFDNGLYFLQIHNLLTIRGNFEARLLSKADGGNFLTLFLYKSLRKIKRIYEHFPVTSQTTVVASPSALTFSPKSFVPNCFRPPLNHGVNRNGKVS